MFELRGHSLLRNEKCSKPANERPSSTIAGFHNGECKASQKSSSTGKMKFGTDDSFRKGIHSTSLVSRIDKVNNNSFEHSRKLQRRNFSESELVKNLKLQITCLEEQVECLKKQQLLHNKLLKPEFLTTLTPTKQNSPMHKSATKHSDRVDNVKTNKFSNNYHQSNTNKALFNSPVLEESQKVRKTEELVQKFPCSESKESPQKTKFENSSALQKSNLFLLQLRCNTVEDELAVVKKAKESTLEELADVRIKLNSMSLELIQSNKERDTLRHQIQQLRSQREAYIPTTKNVIKIAKEASTKNENETNENDVAIATQEQVQNLLHQREFYKMQTDRLQGDTELLQTQLKMLQEKMLSQSAKLITTEVRLRATEDEVQCLKIIAERFNLLCANNKISAFGNGGNADVNVVQKSYNHPEQEEELPRHDQNHQKNDQGFVNAVHELKEWEHELEQNLHHSKEELHNKYHVEQSSEAEKALFTRIADKTSHMDCSNNLQKQLQQSYQQHKATTNQVIDNNEMDIKSMTINSKTDEEQQQERTNFYNTNDGSNDNNDDDDESVVILNEEALENDERSSHSLVKKEIEEERQELIAQDNKINNIDDNLLDIEHEKESIDDKSSKHLEDVSNRISLPVTELLPEHANHDNHNSSEEEHNNCANNKPTAVQEEHDLEEEHTFHKNTQEKQEECAMFTSNNLLADAGATTDVLVTANTATTKEVPSVNPIIPPPPPPPPPAVIPPCPPTRLPNKIESCCVNDQAASSDKIDSFECDTVIVDSPILTCVKDENATNLEELYVGNGATCTNVINSSTTEVMKDKQHNLEQTKAPAIITASATVPVPQSVPVAEMSILDQLRALESEIAAEEVSLQLFLHKHKEESEKSTFVVEIRQELENEESNLQTVASIV